MYALIVDDDPPTLCVIKSAIRWESFGITKTQTAYDLKSAKQAVTQAVPDILLCDIELPDGTGIDLMRWMREMGCTTRIIFITNHSSFEYASAAISGRAFGYITKPFNQKETEATLIKAVNDIVTHDTLVENSQKYLNLKSTLTQDFFRKLAFNELTSPFHSLAQDFPELSTIYDTRPVLAAIPLSFIPTDWNEDLFRIALGNLISTIAADLAQSPVFITYARHQNIYVLFAIPDTLSLIDARGALNAISAACRDKFNCAVTLYLHDPISLEKLSDSRRFMQQYDRANVAKKGDVFLNLNNHSPDAAFECESTFAELKELLNASKAHEVIRLVDATLKHLSMQNALSSHVLSSIIQTYRQTLFAYLSTYDLQAGALFTDLSELEKAADTSMTDCMKWVAATAAKAVQAVKENQQQLDITQQIKVFINEHYMKPLTLEDIARVVYLSPDYAAKLFKTDTGISVKDYINHLRIEKAKQLLSKNGMTISRAAMEVGFENFPYFSTLFKQLTGDSPRGYKAKLQKQ